MTSVQRGIDCSSKLLPAANAALDVHEHRLSAEVTAQMVKEAPGIGGGLTPPVAEVDTVGTYRQGSFGATLTVRGKQP